MNDDRTAELILRAESLMAHSPVAAVVILERVVEAPELPSEQRAEALALLAQHHANMRSSNGFSEARRLLSRAESLFPEGRVARGRLLLGRGYIAFRESQDETALSTLNEAATLLEGSPRIQARVFDTLGMLLSRRGDLDGAHDFFAMAVELKNNDPLGKDPHSLALTYGNLGRLELTRGHYAEAERWLRQDLVLILAHEPKPATEAHVRSQLAQALDGQCPGREVDMRAELERAQQLAPRGSVTSLYILKNVVLLALREGRQSDARRALDELREETKKQKFVELEPWVPLLEGRVLRTGGARNELEQASHRFEEAYKLFLARKMPQETCDAAIDWADALASRGHPRKAALVLENAREAIDAPPAQQEAISTRISARLSSLGGEGLLPALQTRLQRLLGTGPFRPARPDDPILPREAPSPVTVCVLEIRGLDTLWSQEKSADELLNRVGRIFQALAVATSSVGATVDRLGPDRIILHFPGGGAVGRATEAIKRAQARLEELHLEQVHHGEPPLQLASAIAVGWSKHHEVQGAEQLNEDGGALR